MMLMMPTILNTARDSDDRHTASTIVARPRPIASRDYRTPSIRETVICVRTDCSAAPAASNSKLLKLVDEATAIRRADRC